MDEIVATGIKFTTPNANPCRLQLVILDRYEGQLLTTQHVGTEKNQLRTGIAIASNVCSGSR
jgi:hypothetical protein